MSAPQLVGTDVNGNNIVSWNGLYYVIPKSLGVVDLSVLASPALRPEGILAYDSLPRAIHPVLFNPAAVGHTVAKMLQLTKDH